MSSRLLQLWVKCFSQAWVEIFFEVKTKHFFEIFFTSTLRLSFKAISLGEKMLFKKSKKNKNSYEKEQRKNYAISFNHESLC